MKNIIFCVVYRIVDRKGGRVHISNHEALIAAKSAAEACRTVWERVGVGRAKISLVTQVAGEMRVLAQAA